MGTPYSRAAYPSDVSDEEWAFVAPYLTLMKEDAPQRDHDLREVFNGLRWIVRTGKLHLLVEDQGPGLSDTGNLFVPFYTTKPGGSGIGLVLSRQIAEGHGGTLELENRGDGTGARARMVLPLDGA